MARPLKDGLDYFPFDVDFFEDEKIEAISGEFGLKGELATVKLLCAIYRNGYFIVWNDLLKMKLAKRLPGVSSELLEQIVLRLVKWDFFDEGLFNSDKVLTSAGIQKRFLVATKRREKGAITVFACNNGVSVYKNPLTDGINDDISTQSKVKESKVIDTNVSIPTSVGETAPSPSYKSVEKTKTGIWEYLKTGPKEAEPYVDFWNLFAAEKGVPKVRDITKKRRQKLKVRLSEKSFNFCNILKMAGNSEFLLSNSWFAFDWIIENDSNYLKILEGNYQSKPTTNPKDDEIRRKAAEHKQLAERQKQKLREG